MIQEDIENLLRNLVSNGSISNSYLDKFQTYSESTSSNKGFSKSNLATLVGIYYLYLFQSFLNQQEQHLTKIESEIADSVEKFNTNKLDSEEARSVLERLITQKMNLEVTLKHLKQNMHVLPFSQYKTTIEIEKMFVELENLHITDLKELKGIFIKYFNDIEKNKEYLDQFSSLGTTKSPTFLNFLDHLDASMDQTKPLVDTTGLNEDFDKQLVTLFENFFLKFKDKEVKPLKFNIQIGQTLGDKNNESYFFFGNELENLEPDSNQQYVSQLEINSKMSNSSTSSSQINYGQIWDMVGSLVINPVRSGIGIAGFPYIDKISNKIFISVIVEQEVDLSESENLYHQIQSMRISEISDKTDSRRQLIIQEIAESLDIPPELALYPTIIEEYLVRNKSISIDFELRKHRLRTEYYDINRIVFDNLNNLITISDDLEPSSSESAMELLPSPKNNFIDNKIMISANGKSLGKTITEFKMLESWYITTELDLPSNELLDHISVKLRRTEEKEENNLWKLRFTISKVLDIFEAEALLVHNLWKYIWHEKIPISPFELLVSFIGITPSKSINKEFNNDQSVQLARGVVLQNLDLLLYRDPYSIVSKQKMTIGKVINFYLNPQDKQLYLIYCTISEIEILKRLNRDYSQNSLSKLGKRIYKALALKEDLLEIELHPKYLLTYILFYSIQFNVQIDFTNLYEVIHWLITEFELKIIPIDKISAINREKRTIELDA